MPAMHINDDQFDQEVLQSKIPVFVDFYAEWCGPCKMSGPVIDKLADEMKDKVKVVKVDVDNSQLAGKFGVMSIPTVVIFKDGKEVESGGRQIGYPGEQKYREMIAAVTSS